MIKFNFNADVNIKTNGNKVDKKGLKIILMVFGLFFLLAISSIIGFFFFVSSSLNSMQQAVDDYNEQLDSVAALPVLKCKIYTDEAIISPMSGKEAAFYFLRVGYVNYNTYKMTKRPSEIYEKFDYSVIAKYPKEAQLSVNGQLYPIDFKLCIADNISGAEHFTQDTYSTNYKTSYYLKNYRPTENHKISLLKDQHPWVNSFLEPYGLTNLLVKEYVFKNGDSVYIKGKIENGRIVPFVEHMIN